MRKYFITGLLILVPFGITVWVLSSVIAIMDQSLLLLPAAWQKPHIGSYNIHGLGASLTVAMVLVTGLLCNNLFGNYMERLW